MCWKFTCQFSVLPEHICDCVECFMEECFDSENESECNYCLNHETDFCPRENDFE